MPACHGTREDDIERMAREQFGFAHLHRAQREAIDALLAGRDTLVVMPTGAGKSAIYQIAGLLLAGPVVVVSPLLALQRDQIHALEEQHVAEAAAINSSVPGTEREEAFAALEDRELDFVFTAPEQFHRSETIERLKEAGPALFVVDEAQCISEWGDDFRPDYLRLGAVIEELGRPPVLALTATASAPVREEILSRLGMRNPLVLVEGFNRPNIWLGVERFHDEQVQRAALLDAVERAERPGIVYVSTHQHAEEIAGELAERGIAARSYHGGMKAADRRAIEQAFMEGEIAVMVATNAFGLGIDKPDIRFVFHYDIPESVDAYYQEIGRAGRDGESARAILFYRPQDLNLHRFFAGSGKIDRALVERVAEAVEGQDAPVDLSALKEETGLSQAKLTTALTRLDDTGAIDILPTGEVEAAERLADEATIDEALTIEEHRRAADQSRIDMMRGYAEVSDCRREYLLNYFGEPVDEPCGYCDNCEAGIVTNETPADEPFPLNTRVRHQVFGEGLVQRYDGDMMVVLFDDVGYKTLLTKLVTETGALGAIG